MKAVFFDIDGTLWDNSLVIPQSTAEAIGRLRRNGVYTFLCSGRAPALIRAPGLLSLGFDGIVAGCGTYVSFGEKVLVYETIPPQNLEKTLAVLRRYGMPAALEGREYYYVDEEEFAGSPFLAGLKREMGEHLTGIAENYMKWEASKFAAFIKNDSFMKAVEELSPLYDFNIHGRVMAEGVPKGFCKASGMRVICEKLGISKEDIYAFGDSSNDVEMLKYAGHGIAMGDGMEEAKEAADYITEGIYEDGIFKACEHFDLLS